MKKSQKRFILKLLFWVLVMGGVAWAAFAPPPRHNHPSSHVAIRMPVMPPMAKPTDDVPLPELPPVGDEKAQPLPPQPPATAEVPLIQPPPAPVPMPVMPPRAPGSKPAIAIVIDDMGLDIRDSQRAVGLPAPVTLSYMPYAPRLREQTRDAREKGHELLLHMPMEPVGHDDPGPGALLTSLSPDEIHQRFATALASFTGFDGVNNHMGSKFTADASGMEIVIDELQQRNLFFLDSRTSPRTVGLTLAQQHGLPAIARDVFLDDEINAKAIGIQLEHAETAARKHGYVVAIGHPHTATLQALEAWIPEAQKRGFELVPLRQLVRPGG